MICFLAGSVITVSATVVGVWAEFPMPGLNDIYPNSIGWVVAVLGVGAALIADLLFRKTSQLVQTCRPLSVNVRPHVCKD